VVTGLGVVSSLGLGWKTFWESLKQGRSGISKISSFDTNEFSTHYGGEVKEFNPEDLEQPRSLKQMGRASHMAIAAAKMALEDSGYTPKDILPEGIGLCIGTTSGESIETETLIGEWIQNRLQQEEKSRFTQSICNVISSNVAKELCLEGLNFIIPTACAAGNYAIGFSYDNIVLGHSDMMLAGGVDVFSWIVFIGFNRLSAIAPQVCQPFDKNRKGIIAAEGAAIIVLESLESAMKRDAHIYAEIKGYGTSCDAYHMTIPTLEGMSKVMEDALKWSQINKDEVDYINAHGTGTRANDKSECAAIKKVFGDSYKDIPVSSIKSMLGHTMGAASALEAVACALAVNQNIIPPTINYQTPDPECDIDCVPHEARTHTVNIALNNSFAFGGNNASVVFSKFKG
jgi:3-oxoacyl-[acyl-carrier-protein] synthase II